jgi:hypothetical protein
MRKKLTLQQQALAEEKRLQFEKIKKASASAMTVLDVLAILLPNYKPLPEQERYHRSGAYEKGIKGGYQSGKTTAFCAEAIALAFINRPAPVLLVSPSYDLAVDIVAEKLKELCGQNSLAFDFFDSKGLFIIQLSNNAKDNCRLYLAGSDKPRFLKGYTVAAAGMDEPFVQSKEAYDIINARISKKTKLNRFFWSGTPEPEYMSWGMEYFEKDHNENALFTITLPTSSNIYLPKSYLKNLKAKYDAKMQEVYLEGRYVMLTANRVYFGFERKRNVISSLKTMKAPEEIILSFDFNVDPMTCVLVTLSDGIFYQQKEFVLSSSNTAELCSAVITYLKNHLYARPAKSIIITGDATGRKRGTRGNLSDYEIIRDEFTKAEIPFYFNVPNENPAVRDRVNFVNKLFESERYLIDETCVKSINDRELVSWKQSAEGFLIDKSKKGLTHLSDAGDYAVWNNQVLLTGGDHEESVYIQRRAAR